MKIAVLIYLIALNALTQVLDYTSFNNNQSNSKYMYLETDIVKVIYQKGQKDKAIQVAGEISKHSEQLNEDFEMPTKKISIILRSDTVLSNGYVQMAPFKSEFYDSPYMQGQLDFGSWLENLSLHEWRHVGQFSQFYDGVGKGLYYFLGETGIALAAVWSTPSWVFEGDAVINETEHTAFGRGRNAAFNRRLRQIILEHTDLSYEEFYFGAINTKVPDFYKFGYYFLVFLKNKYNFDATQGFQYAAHKAYNPYAFQNSIEISTGVELDDLIIEFQEYYKEKWRTFDYNQSLKIIKKDKEKYTDFKYPFINSKGELIYLKTGVANLRQFVKLVNGKEISLHYPGTIPSNSVRFDNDSIFWTEARVNLRWGPHSYSVICKLDTIKEETNCYKDSGYEYTYIKNEFGELSSRYDGKSSIYLNQNEVLSSRKSLYINPFFINKNNIGFIHKDSQGIFSLKTFHLNKKKETLFLKSRSSIRRPIYNNDYIYFEWEKSESEEIYRINIKSKKIEQITKSKYAALYPYLHNGKMYFSRQGKNGLEIVESNIKKVKELKRNNFIAPKREYFRSGQNKIQWNEKEYSDELFNFHSWFILPPLLSPSWSISVVSDNITETLHTEIGISNSVYTNSNSIYSLFSYRDLFPFLEVGVSSSQRSSSADDYDTSWDEKEINIGPRFAIQNNWGRWSGALSFTAYATQLEVENKTTIISDTFNNGTMLGHIFNLNYQLISNKELRRYKSPFSIYLDLTLKETSDEDTNQFGRLANGKLIFTIGLPKMGSMGLHYERENQLENEYQYLSEVVQARGYAFNFSHDISNFKIDLSYPLTYSNFAISDILYFKRFDLGLFYDQMDIKDVSNKTDNDIYSSYGMELITQTYFFRTLNFPLGIGLRYLYRNSPDPTIKGDAGEIFLDSVIAF